MFLLRSLLAQGSLLIALPEGRKTLYGSGAPLVRLRIHVPLPWEPWRRPECRLIEAYRRNYLTIVGGTLRDLHYLFYLNRAASERNLVWQAMRWLERLVYPGSLDRMIELDRMFGFHAASAYRFSRRRDGGRRFRLSRARFRGALRSRRRVKGARPSDCIVQSRRPLPLSGGPSLAVAFIVRGQLCPPWRKPNPPAAGIDRLMARPLSDRSRRRLALAKSCRRIKLDTVRRGWNCALPAPGLTPSDRWIRIETT